MVNRWVTAALILTVLSLLGSAIVISQVAQGNGGGSGESNANCPNGQFATSESSNGSFFCGAQNAVSTEAAAGCPVNQFATTESVNGGLGCATALTTQTLVTTEKAAGCPGAQQFVTTESANGDFSCGLVTYGSCPANQFVTAITTTTLNCATALTSQTSQTVVANTCILGRWAVNINASSFLGCNPVPDRNITCSSGTCLLALNDTAVVTLRGSGALTVTLAHQPDISSYYISNNKSIAANICPATGLFYVAGVTYTTSSCFSLASGIQLFAWSDGVNWYGTASNYLTAVSTEAIASCGAGLFATSESNDGSFSCNAPNINFQNKSSTCTDTTSSTVLMAGFALGYTTVGTGKVTVNINFQLGTPAATTLNTKFRIAFGTGVAPSCNGAVTGTKVGNQYEVGDFAGTASFVTVGLSVGVITLSAATTYWFDIQMQDSSSASWVFSNPQMTVLES